MFNIANLNNEKGRYALIAESILPIFIMFILGYTLIPQNAQNPILRPPSWIFVFLWFLIIVMWTLALLITAMDESSTLIIALVGSLSLISLLACFHCLIYNSYKSLLLCFVTMISTTIVALNGSAPQDSRIVSTLFYSLIAIWFGIALNHKKTKAIKKEI